MVLNPRGLGDGRMKVLAIVPVLALAACTQSVNEMSYSQLQAYAATMVEKCQKQGVPDEQLRACAEQEMRADQARRMRQRQFGAALSQASADYGRSVQANRPVTTNCHRFGNNVSCTSY